MKKEAIALMILLALAMMPILTTTTSAHTIGTAYPTQASSITPPLDWYQYPTGYNVEQSLQWNPEYLQVQIPGSGTVESDTTIILQGLDANGAPIEAKVFLPAHQTIVESLTIFNDTISNKPVAFSKITDILQQNGTHNDQFYIRTVPEPFQEYLGEYHSASGAGWSPGTYLWGSKYAPAFYGPIGTKYLVGHGPGLNCTTQNVAVEPSNPDPLIIYINWHEIDGDLTPENYTHTSNGVQYASEWSDTSGLGSSAQTWLYVTGLDETGNLVSVNVTIPADVQAVGVPTLDCAGNNFTFSTICSVTGPTNAPDSYYFFTNPTGPRTICVYTTLIDHIDIYANSYDLLANPGFVDSTYPGVTNITITLVDADGNLIHPAPGEDVDVNFATTGGTIEPSYDVWINSSRVDAVANLTADTNARTVNVTADAHVPSCPPSPGPYLCPQMDCFAWTQLTFDGINSHAGNPAAWPITEMYWGYHTYTDPATGGSGWINNPVTMVGGMPTCGAYIFPVPPEPPLPACLGGPNDADAPYTIKFNGPIYEVSIPLYAGCNLVSSPVEPLMEYSNGSLAQYTTSYPGSSVNNDGIPMDLLFNKTDSYNIEIIWWYCDGSWAYYIPSTNTGSGDLYFKDGVGYWIMCEKPCTLEISGVNMQNGPFTPPGGVIGTNTAYTLNGQEWSLVGVTTITGFTDYHEYLASLYAGSTIASTGDPIWVYYAAPNGNGVWVRNPPWGLWPGQAFWVYNVYESTQYIAP